MLSIMCRRRKYCPWGGDDGVVVDYAPNISSLDRVKDKRRKGRWLVPVKVFCEEYERKLSSMVGGVSKPPAPEYT
jgi:hypothetical protein